MEVGLAGGVGLAGSGGHELMRVAGVAVAAGELAAAVWIDAPGHPGHAFGVDAAEDGADVEGAELDEVAVVGVGGFEGHAGYASGSGRGLIEDGEERFGGGE
jgi:hypothetical protein